MSVGALQILIETFNLIFFDINLKIYVEIILRAIFFLFCLFFIKNLGFI